MMKIQVKSVHFHADSKLVSFIEKKLTRLSRYFDHGTVEADVHLKLQETGGAVREKITEVILKVPGNNLIDKKTGKTFEEAITSSAETLKRQLIKHKEKVTTHRSAGLSPEEN
jgi:putative sigma-54 modulation protein